MLALALAAMMLAVVTVGGPNQLNTDLFQAAIDVNKLPLSFTPNQGQAPDEVRFEVRGFAGSLRFLPDRVLWALPGALDGGTADSSQLQLQFLGNQAELTVTSSRALPGTVNYLIGDDPTGWVTDIPTYGSILYEGLYPGIDLHYSGQQSVAGQGSLKGTYTVAPGADPGQIQWRYQGTADVQLDAGTGNLLISVPGVENHTLVEEAPVSWQEIGGRRIPVESQFVLGANNSIGFALGAYDPTHPLIIDPTLIFSTYFGTSTNDTGRTIAVDSQGNIFIAGWTESVNFPVTPDALQPTSTGGTCIAPPPFPVGFPCSDGFLSKFSPDGSTLLYSTYFGGSGDDGIRAMALDSNDNIYLTGWTTSTDFPTMNPIQPNPGSPTNRTWDSFVARLAADGSSLQYSTYLGGNGRDYADAIALDDQNNAYIAGTTESPDFPTVNAVQGTYGGGFFDGTITKVNAAGTAFDYSSYLGGDDLEYAFGVDVDSAGSAYITGFTLSDDFPTFNAMQPIFGGGIEAYVTKLTANGNAFVYSTYFGNDDTRGFDIRVNDNGYAYIVGVTNSPTFPTVNPLQANYSGEPYDGIISRFLPDGSAVDFSTYLGGNSHETIRTLTLDSSNNLLFVGWSSSTDFPLSDAIQNTPGGGGDAIVGAITGDLSSLAFSTYFGGTTGDWGRDIAVDDSGVVHITGNTSSTDFPTLNPIQPNSGGGAEGFLAKIDLTLPDIPQAFFISSSPDIIGETTVFTNTSSGGNLTFQWDFGDGSPMVTETNPVHIYPGVGFYTATLTATNSFGSNAFTGTVEIVEAPVPQAAFISSSPDIIGETTVFTNTSIGENLTFQWDFGDGSSVVTETNPVHLYTVIGFYTVTLTATNSYGNSSVFIGNVEIVEVPPLPSFTLYVPAVFKMDAN